MSKSQETAVLGENRMSKSQETAVSKNEENNTIESEDRIDENGISSFRSMGYTARLTDNQIAIYRAFKSKKDKLQPGRLTPEAMAFVSVISDMFDGILNPKE